MLHAIAIGAAGVAGVLVTFWVGIRFGRGVKRSDDFEARVRAQHRRERG